MSDIKQKIAVKSVIVNAEGKILLLQKSNDQERHAGNSGRYNLSGGKIDPGEPLLEALVREVNEETGLSLTLASDSQPMYVGEWRPIVRGTPLQIVGLFYVCATWEGVITLNSEHKRFVWVGREEVGQYDILPPEGEVVKTYFAQA